MIRISALLLLSLFVVSSLTSNAQGRRGGNFGNFSGIVGSVINVDSGDPVSFVSVTLLNPQDSSAIGGANGDVNGRFRVDVGAGEYIVRFSAIGYQQAFENVVLSSDKNMHVFRQYELAPLDAMGDAVVVEAERAFVEIQGDKRVFNVANDLNVKGGNAEEVLENIPSLEVDVDGNVSLRGSEGVRILIDGRESILLGLNPEDALKQIPAAQIEKVEVITNPSARYEAEGTSGIINIVLKKNDRSGWSGSFEANASTLKTYGGSANLKYSFGDVSVFGVYSYSKRNREREITSYSEYYNRYLEGDDEVVDTTILDQFDVNDGSRYRNFVSGGVEWKLARETSLTASFGRKFGGGERMGTLEIMQQLPSEAPVFSERLNTEDEEETGNEVTLAFRHEFDGRDHYLDIRADFEDEHDQEIGWAQNDRADSVAGFGIEQRIDQLEQEQELSFDADYVYTVAENTQIEAGVSFDFEDMSSDYIVEDLFADEWQRNLGVSNNLDYKEQVLAAYFMYSGKLGDLSYQGGLRAENTETEVALEQTEEVYDKSYFHLFPSVFLGYTLSQDNEVQLSYSRRIRRPGYRSLNPFTSYTNPYRFWTGNPDLAPELSNSFELNYVWYMKDLTFTSGLYYRLTEGVMQRITEFDDKGISYIRPQNLSDQTSYGLELSAMWKATDWWNLIGSVDFFASELDGGNLGTEYQSEFNSWGARLNSRFTLWGDVMLQANVMYRAPSETVQGERNEHLFVNLAASRDFFDDAMTVNISARDLLNTMKFGGESYGENFYSKSEYAPRSQGVRVSVSWRFNREKERSRNDGGGMEEDFEG